MADAKLMQKRSFQKESENVIASYSYIDIADGSGIVDWYLYKAETTGDVDTRRISSGTTKSRVDGVTATNDSTMALAYSAGNPWPREISIEFDSKPFNTSRTVEGTMSIIGRHLFTLGYNGRTLSGKMELIHVNGSTSAETIIGTYTTAELTTGFITYDYHYIVPLTTKLFKIGDYMKFKFTFIVDGSDTAAVSVSYWTVGCDPEDTDWYTKLEIPFKIET